MAASDYKNISEEGLLKEAEELYKALPPLTQTVEVPLNPRTKALTIPAKVRVTQEVLLYRMSDISECAIDLFRKRRLNPAFILTRAAYETSALLFLIYERIERAIETRKLDDIDVFLFRVAAGGKSDSTAVGPDGKPVIAVNIAKAIKRLDKKFKLKGKGLGSHYGFLCDFAHPNCPGGFMAYAQFVRKNSVAVCSFDISCKLVLQPLDFGLVALSTCLDIFTHYYKAIADIQERLTDLCEAKKKKN